MQLAAVRLHGIVLVEHALCTSIDAGMCTWAIVQSISTRLPARLVLRLLAPSRDLAELTHPSIALLPCSISSTFSRPAPFTTPILAAARHPPPLTALRFRRAAARRPPPTVHPLRCIALLLPLPIRPTTP